MIARDATAHRALARSIATSAVLGAAALLLATAALATRPPAAHARPAARPPGQVLSTCVAKTTKVALPAEVGVGATAELTLTMAFTGCPGGYDGPLHVVLALDAGGVMVVGDANQQMRKAARVLIDHLLLETHPNTQVGVVSFTSAAKVLCQLTNRSAQASGCIGRVGVGGQSCTDCGIKAALGVLKRGRPEGSDGSGIREVIIVVTAAIDAALADPSRVGGWGQPCRLGQPLGPMNPPRRWLDLRNGNLPWHPVFNGVVFKCGCG